METYPIFMDVDIIMIYKFSAIPIEIPIVFFYRNGKANPQIHMEWQGAPNGQNNLESQRTHMLQFHNFLQATVIEIV